MQEFNKSAFSNQQSELRRREQLEARSVTNTMQQEKEAKKARKAEAGKEAEGKRCAAKQ